ncbi:hypothetical protein [Thioalkalivibrio sp. ALgr3]|uniref:hypothetical protein n=1 Tax=Thioalkalivibrio sp. ALgr3 TaxID=1239292 RepID=UPI0012DE9DE6|nr:hypothetical protein [Thioalkalivibrio sp. ALgr3]
MTNQSPHLQVSQSRKRLSQSFSFDPRTKETLNDVQVSLNGMSGYNFSRSIVLRVAIENLARTIESAMEMNNHTALEALSKRAWAHSSKKGNKEVAK